MDPYSEMHLLPEPLFSIPSDNLSMGSVTGTPYGRIFLAGHDGCLHEVIYQVIAGIALGAQATWNRVSCLYKCSVSYNVVYVFAFELFWYHETNSLRLGCVWAWGNTC